MTTWLDYIRPDIAEEIAGSLTYEELADTFGVMIGNGFNNPSTMLYLSTGTQTADATELVASVVTTFIPAVPSTPAIPPTYSTLDTLKRTIKRNWDTWARSKDPVPLGSYADFSIQSSPQGVCIALAPANSEGLLVPNFKFSIMADVQGVKVQESGVIVATLTSRSNSATSIRIYRQSDNSIVYASVFGTEVTTYTSTLANPFPASIPLYLYAHLYASGDQINNAALATGSVQYARV